MSKVNGQLVTCDRCGKTIFRECIGEGETDGGFTRWNKFTDLPKDWTKPYNIGDLCPDCSLEWELLEQEFMSRRKDFMEAKVCNT